MTAEIAILNMSAVALAADSAVTVETPTGQKTYNTNKLFTLSKRHPVGIMVYDSATISGIPWETAIKVYRDKLGDKSFDFLSGYADDFAAFLANEKTLFPEEIQKEAFLDRVRLYFHSMVMEMNEAVADLIANKGQVLPQEVESIVNECAQKHWKEWSEKPFLPHIQPTLIDKIEGKHGVEIEKVIQSEFEKLPLSKESISNIKKLAANIFCRDRFLSKSGVVIAGFGKKETLPQIISLIVGDVFLDTLKYKKERDGRIDHQTSARIAPFAQREMVDTFMSGIGLDFRLAVNDFLNSALQEHSTNILKNLDISSKEKEGLIEKIKEIGDGVVADLNQKLIDFSVKYYSSPILDIVGSLPKEELAIMAETLIHLTLIKRRMSIEAETVGGPIDVAVISKGDGFIWIKRKHYFNPELNRHFFSNYYSPHS